MKIMQGMAPNTQIKNTHTQEAERGEREREKKEDKMCSVE